MGGHVNLIVTQPKSCDTPGEWRQIINDCSITQLGEPAKMFPLNQYLCLYSESKAVHAEGMCCSMCFQRSKSVTFCFKVETCML